MKKILFYILLAGVVSSCILSRKKDNIDFDIEFNDTTALKPFIFKELKAYISDIDSFPPIPSIWQSAYALVFDSVRYKYLDIFAHCPVMPYHIQLDHFSIDTIHFNSNFRLVGCFYKDTILIAIYDRSDISPQGIRYYDTTKLDTGIKKYIPSDSLMQFMRDYPFGEIGPIWHYQIIDDSLKLVEKGRNWSMIK